MKTIRIFLLVLIIIGIVALSTYKIWVPKLVNYILQSEGISVVNDGSISPLYATYMIDGRPIALTEAEARVIAGKSCIKGGEALSQGIYNENSKTWWYDANLNATRPGCSPACVVDTVTRKAEVNWRCTGAKEPVACTMDA